MFQSCPIFYKCLNYPRQPQSDIKINKDGTSTTKNLQDEKIPSGNGSNQGVQYLQNIWCITVHVQAKLTLGIGLQVNLAEIKEEELKLYFSSAMERVSYLIIAELQLDIFRDKQAQLLRRQITGLCIIYLAPDTSIPAFQIFCYRELHEAYQVLITQLRRVAKFKEAEKSEKII